MSGPETFRPGVIARGSALLFLVIAGGLTAITLTGLDAVEGAAYIMLLATGIFPILMLAVAALRMGVLWSRRLTLTPEALEHIQVFKNHRIPYSDIFALEVLRWEEEGGISTLRIRWGSGGKELIYLDYRSVQGWDRFCEGLLEAAPTGVLKDVESFEPV